LSTVPIHYRLNLISNTEKDEFDDVKTINKIPHKSVAFDGKAIIIINILYPISLITLQKLYQHITSANLITRNGITYEMRDYVYDQASNLLKMYFGDILLPGFYSLNMEFVSNATHDNIEGFFKNTHRNKDGVIQ